METIKSLPLTKGLYTTVSEIDFAVLNKYKWQSMYSKNINGYYAIRKAVINGIKTTVYLHREIMGLRKGDKLTVDHIDNNTLNNTRENLRIVTYRENNQNKKSHRNGKLVGCHYDKARSHLKTPWRAYLTILNKTFFLGNYQTELEAHDVYMTACLKYNLPKLELAPIPAT